MANHYNLAQIEEIADGDALFIEAIVSAFLEEVPAAIEEMSVGLSQNDHEKVYQNAHMIKPTFAQFRLSVYDDLLVLQEWGSTKSVRDVSGHLKAIMEEISLVIVEMKFQFNL